MLGYLASLHRIIIKFIKLPFCPKIFFSLETLGRTPFSFARNEVMSRNKIIRTSGSFLNDHCNLVNRLIAYVIIASSIIQFIGDPWNFSLIIA